MAGSDRGGRRIMVAVDESEESMYALQWTVDNLLNQKEHGQIIVMHAEAPAVSKLALAGHAAAFAGHHVVGHSWKKRESHHTEVLSRARDICEKHNVSIEFKMMPGEARYAICEAANTVKADLLVVGSHGHGAVKRAVSGSVSEHCTRHCKCPVLVVKKPHR